MQPIRFQAEKAQQPMNQLGEEQKILVVGSEVVISGNGKRPGFVTDSTFAYTG